MGKQFVANSWYKPYPQLDGTARLIIPRKFDEIAHRRPPGRAVDRRVHFFRAKVPATAVVLFSVFISREKHDRGAPLKRLDLTVYVEGHDVNHESGAT